MKSKTEKIYCYVDETGQDTLGELFVVAVVVSLKSASELEKRLIAIEKSSGKYSKKWHKTRKKERINYIQSVLELKLLKENLFFKDYQNAGKEYLYLIVYALAELMIANFKDAKLNLTIDALTKKEIRFTAVELRHLGIKIDMVKGKRDESSALLRLADSLAGFIREGIEGKRDYKRLFDSASKSNIIKKIE